MTTAEAHKKPGKTEMLAKWSASKEKLEYYISACHAMACYITLHSGIIESSDETVLSGAESYTRMVVFSLKRRNQITRVQAMREYKCYRTLALRIMKAKGWGPLSDVRVPRYKGVHCAQNKRLNEFMDGKRQTPFKMKHGRQARDRTETVVIPAETESILQRVGQGEIQRSTRRAKASEIHT